MKERERESEHTINFTLSCQSKSQSTYNDKLLEGV